MPALQVDQDIINEIMRLKQTLKGSIDSVMEGKLTAEHLASDASMLLDALDRLESMTGSAAQPAPPVQEAAPAAPVEQPAPEVAPVEQSAQEVAPAEQPQP